MTYIERERAHPYRTFLHYNSWFDIGFFTPYTQQDALDRIHEIGDELNKKRGVTLDSFLFDDGWDDHNDLWKIRADFKDGFTPLKEAAAEYGTAPGVWLSPWGGYGPAKKERVAAATKDGLRDCRWRACSIGAEVLCALSRGGDGDGHEVWREPVQV